MTRQRIPKTLFALPAKAFAAERPFGDFAVPNLFNPSEGANAVRSGNAGAAFDGSPLPFPGTQHNPIRKP